MENNEKQDVMREVGRLVTGGYYDHQEIRIKEWNRIRDILRKTNEGIDMSKPEEKQKEKTYAEKYKDTNIPFLLKDMLADGKLDQEEFDYIERTLKILKEAEKYEEHHKVLMEQYISREEIWINWLAKVRGIGPVIAASLIKNFGYCEKFQHVSSLWKYCGLHVVNGKAPKREKGKKLDFRLSLRTFTWKISDSFVKQRTVPYRGIYDSEKERQLKLMENGAENAPKNKKHADLRARRKAVKVFLQHYWKIGREIKKLPTDSPYAIEKMGHSNYIEPIGVED